MSYTFLGATTTNATITNIGAPIAAGSTRFNTTTNHLEVYDGTQWTSFGPGREETMQEMVIHLEDKIAETIEELYKDNTTIHDAFKAWEEANERFKVVLALAEKVK